MPLKIIRVAAGKNSTLSHLYLDDIFLCFLLEDKIRAEKIAGKTCIPEGNYRLLLNTTAGMNVRYKQRYPALHQGMIEIVGIPHFNLVFFHIGNDIGDTTACPLTGHYWTKIKGEYTVQQSAFAYQEVYPKLLTALKAGNNQLRIINQIH